MKKIIIVILMLLTSIISLAEKGKASYYGSKGMTAAHKTLPFGTKVKVTNVKNGKSVIVTINDRGPFVKGRIIDLSTAAFASIGSTDSGIAKVKLEILK